MRRELLNAPISADAYVKFTACPTYLSLRLSLLLRSGLSRSTQGTQAAAAKAAEEVKRARSELEATQALLEQAVQEKEAAVQEKAAGYALLRTEQGKGGQPRVCSCFCACFLCLRGGPLLAIGYAVCLLLLNC